MLFISSEAIGIASIARSSERVSAVSRGTQSRAEYDELWRRASATNERWFRLIKRATRMQASTLAELRAKAEIAASLPILLEDNPSDYDQPMLAAR